MGQRPQCATYGACIPGRNRRVMSLLPSSPPPRTAGSSDTAPSLARILRVLLLGAAPPTRWLLESGLSASRHTTRAVLRPADDLSQCVAAAASGEYDAVLLDLGA